VVRIDKQGTKLVGVASKDVSDDQFDVIKFGGLLVSARLAYRRISR
jgi:hypothetical protein